MKQWKWLLWNGLKWLCLRKKKENKHQKMAQREPVVATKRERVRIAKRHPRWHRWLGKVLVVCIVNRLENMQLRK